MSARSQAVARQDQQIEASTSRAIAARAENENRPRTALEAMAARLQVTTRSLQSTLMNTAFKGCSEAEFVALVIVANAFDLNPLLREIYAFPKKGGGIQAIVGYDGWIKIADRHPQYDGYEADHIRGESGAVEAIEGICHRKDRSHPSRKIVYLKEFKRNTDPWNNSPNHMLDVRCFCQTIRLGLGVSGLGVEGVDDVDGGEVASRAVALPAPQTLAEELDDEIPRFDKETGEEIVEPATDARGMTQVDEDTARELDAFEGGDETEAEPVEQPDARAATLSGIKAQISAAKNERGLKAVETEWLKVAAMYDDADERVVDDLIAARRTAFRAQGGAEA